MSCMKSCWRFRNSIDGVAPNGDAKIEYENEKIKHEINRQTKLKMNENEAIERLIVVVAVVVAYNCCCWIFFLMSSSSCVFFMSSNRLTEWPNSRDPKQKQKKKNCGNKRKRVRSCSSICRSLWTHFSSHSSRLLSGCGKRANVAIYTSIYTKMNDEKSSILHWIKDANSRKKRPTEKYQPSRRQAMK